MFARRPSPKAIFGRSPLGGDQGLPIAVRAGRRIACGVRAAAMAVDRSTGALRERGARGWGAQGAVGAKVALRARGRAIDLIFTVEKSASHNNHFVIHFVQL